MEKINWNISTKWNIIYLNVKKEDLMKVPTNSKGYITLTIKDWYYNVGAFTSKETIKDELVSIENENTWFWKRNLPILFWLIK